MTKDELDKLPDETFVTGTQSGLRFYGYYSKTLSKRIRGKVHAQWSTIKSNAVKLKDETDKCTKCTWETANKCPATKHIFGVITVADVETMEEFQTGGKVTSKKKESYLSPFSGKWV